MSVPVIALTTMRHPHVQICLNVSFAIGYDGPTVGRIGADSTIIFTNHYVAFISFFSLSIKAL